MSFDVGKMREFAKQAIKKFADEHQNETFYAFAIDASLLCLNSVEKYDATLVTRRQQWAEQNTPVSCFAELDEFDQEDALEMYALVGQGMELAEYQQKFVEDHNAAIGDNPYETQDGQNELRNNPGDWAYQGFAELSNGFDAGAYDHHYHASDDEQESSAYKVAMQQLIQQLQDENAFADLNVTHDFVAHSVEHNY